MTRPSLSKLSSKPSLRSALIMMAALASASAALLTTATATIAERFESDSYVIQFGNFNITSGEKNSASYNLTDTVGQTGAGPYGQIGQSNYFVGGGFQYIYPLRDFSFSISTILVNLGTLITDTHSLQSHTLIITTRPGSGYKVYAYIDHPLQQPDGSATIPSTTCDSGGCTIDNAGLWTNQTIPGFGYNMSGTDVPGDFLSSNYFRPFADASLGQTMQVVMSSTGQAIDAQSTIIYKAGISGGQAAGRYSTTVKFVAVPSY